jgi:aspartate/methionine/tyrosine aminotransferase
VLAKELLERTHVAVLPGESFGGNGKGYLRLSYAASEADIREALRRMAVFLG